MDTLQQELLQELPEFEKKTQLFYHKEMSVKDYKAIAADLVPMHNEAAMPSCFGYV